MNEIKAVIWDVVRDSTKNALDKPTDNAVWNNISIVTWFFTGNITGNTTRNALDQVMKDE